MKKVFLLLISLLFIGCATTNISSFKNPDVDFANYKKIVVCGNSRDIEFRKILESDLVVAFNENLINAVSSIELISPVKEYSDIEIRNILMKNNIDGLLSVEVIASTEEFAYISQRVSTSYRSKYVNGRYVSEPYTTTSGGYSVSYPKASFEIILKDLSTGQIAFKATANSKGDEFADMKTISKSLASKVVEEYIRLSVE